MVRLLSLPGERTRERLAAPEEVVSNPADHLIIGEMDVTMSRGFAAMLGQKLSLVERLDALQESAEVRRTAALRDLHRHREALAEQAQKVTRRIEEAEFRTLDGHFKTLSPGGDERLGRVPVHDDERLKRMPALDDERLKT